MYITLWQHIVAYTRLRMFNHVEYDKRTCVCVTEACDTFGDPITVYTYVCPIPKRNANTTR